MLLNQSRETHPALNTSGHGEKQQPFAKDPFSLLGCSALPSCTGNTKMQVLTSSVLGGTQPLPRPCPPTTGNVFHLLGCCFLVWVFFVGVLLVGWVFLGFSPLQISSVFSHSSTSWNRGSHYLSLHPSPTPKDDQGKAQTGLVAEYYGPQSKVTRTQQLSLSQSNASEPGRI